MSSYNTEAQYSDTSQFVYPEYGPTLNGTVYPMMSYNNCETRKPNRRPSQQDVDLSPMPLRRYTNVGTHDVQLNNGLHNGVASGRRINYAGSGYLYGVMPIIPGQTRDNVGGFHRKGPSAYTVQDVFTAGPGSQPDHPGGPGKIAGATFINPMTG